MDEAKSDEAIRSKYGNLLVAKFMKYLTSDPSIWKDRAVCINHDPYLPPDRRGKKRKANAGQDSFRGLSASL